MQKLGSTQIKLATQICPFCASIHQVLSGQRKVVWSKKRLGLLPCLALKLKGALWMRKKGRMKRKELFFFPCKIGFFVSFLLSQKASAVSGESFKSNLWHVVGAFVFLPFSLLSQGFSKLKLRFHDLVKLTWMWADTARRFHPFLIACSQQFPYATTGSWSGGQVRDPFAWIIYSLFWPGCFGDELNLNNLFKR